VFEFFAKLQSDAGATARYTGPAQNLTRCSDGNQGFYVNTYDNGTAADEPFSFVVP
jgi:hypothetical protein